MATDWRCPPDSDPHRGLQVPEPGVQPLHHLRGGRCHRRVVEGTGPGAQLAPEEHVAGRVDVVGQRQLLVDDLDPVAASVARVVDLHGLPVDADLPRVGGMRARQRVHQRRLAGAVAPDEADDLTRVEVDA